MLFILGKNCELANINICFFLQLLYIDYIFAFRICFCCCSWIFSIFFLASLKNGKFCLSKLKLRLLKISGWVRWQFDRPKRSLSALCIFKFVCAGSTNFHYPRHCKQRANIDIATFWCLGSLYTIVLILNVNLCKQYQSYCCW